MPDNTIQTQQDINERLLDMYYQTEIGLVYLYRKII